MKTKTKTIICQKCKGLGGLVASDTTKQGFPVALITESDSSTATAPNRTTARPAECCLRVGAAVTNAALSHLLSPHAADLGVRLHLVFFIVASSVLSISCTQNSNDHANDHSKPDQGKTLEEQEEREKDPLDTTVHTDWAIKIFERTQEMAPVIRVSVR